MCSRTVVSSSSSICTSTFRARAGTPGARKYPSTSCTTAVPPACPSSSWCAVTVTVFGVRQSDGPKFRRAGLTEICRPPSRARGVTVTAPAGCVLSRTVYPALAPSATISRPVLVTTSATSLSNTLIVATGLPSTSSITAFSSPSASSFAVRVRAALSRVGVNVTSSGVTLSAAGLEVANATVRACAGAGTMRTPMTLLRPSVRVAGTPTRYTLPGCAAAGAGASRPSAPSSSASAGRKKRRARRRPGRGSGPERPCAGVCPGSGGRGPCCAPAGRRAHVMPLGRWAAGPLGRWAAGLLYGLNRGRMSSAIARAGRTGRRRAAPARIVLASNSTGLKKRKGVLAIRH